MTTNKLALFLVLILSYFSYGESYEEESVPSLNPIQTTMANTHFEIDYNFGRFIGLKENYTGLSLFLPVAVSNHSLFFIDLRGYRFKDHHWALSTGAAFRFWGEEQTIFGFNAYFDERWTPSHKNFQRSGFGLEWLSPSWDFRTNVYIPFGSLKHRSRKIIYHDYIGNYQATVQHFYYAISGGWDCELGALLAYWDKFNLYGSMGPYVYHLPKKGFFAGGQATLELNWGSYLGVQIRQSYDRIYHSHLQGKIFVNIPFDKLTHWPSLDEAFSAFFTQPVKRQSLIFTHECCHYDWNW